MNITLTHPIHGAKVAINELEMDQDLKNGWVRYNQDTPAQVASDPVAKRKPRRVTEQPVEQPNEVPSFLASVSDESEGT